MLLLSLKINLATVSEKKKCRRHYILTFLKARCIESWQRHIMSEPNGFAALPGVRKDFRGQWYVKYWHSGRSEAQEPKRKKGGIMPVRWSQAALHSSMLPLLPQTDINTRNQLNWPGCYPRDFGGGGNQSIWRQGKRKGQSPMKESKLQLQHVVMFCLCLWVQPMMSSLVFILDLFIIQECFPSSFLHMMVIWRLTFLSGCWWETKEQLRTGTFLKKARFRCNLVLPAAVDWWKTP